MAIALDDVEFAKDYYGTPISTFQTSDPGDVYKANLRDANIHQAMEVIFSICGVGRVYSVSLNALCTVQN